MKLRNLLLGAVAAIATGITSVSAETLRVGMDGGYPPFASQNSAGEMEGFDVDIANALCEELGMTCEIVVQGWDGLIPSLVEGKFDVIVNSMSITEERLKSVDFSEKYYSNYLTALAKADSGVTMDNLQSKTIGVQRSTISADWAETELGSRADVKLYDTQTAIYEDLAAGRIDAVVSDYLPLVDWAKDKPEYAIIGDPINIGDEIGVAIAKGREEMRDKISAAIKSLRENGKYAEINSKYFDVDIY